MKTSIVMYAMFLINGIPQENISWGLQFSDMNQCIDYIELNKINIVEGVQSFGNEMYNDNAILSEIGCARATANFDQPELSDDPKIEIKVKLYQGD